MTLPDGIAQLVIFITVDIFLEQNGLANVFDFNLVSREFTVFLNALYYSEYRLFTSED